VLTAIKLLDTVVWALLAGSILALPAAAVFRRFRLAAILSVIVLLEWLLAVSLIPHTERQVNERCGGT
jgi:peptidoglycan/LPS O-acetylase OafA/YrhL